MTDHSSSEQAFERTPLLAFSLSTCLQIQFLREIATDIRTLTSSAVRTDGPWDGNALAKAQGLFWLWILGAYEVVRTMAQAKQCFAPDALQRIVQEKKHLAQIRMPFAKQEREGKRLPVWREFFSDGCNADGDIIFTIAGNTVHAKVQLVRFEAFVTGFECADILMSHEQSYL